MKKPTMFEVREEDITKIHVEDRARKDLGDLTELKRDIERVGLLNPILITKEGKLIAGERRLTACKELQKTSILVRIMPDMEQDDLLMIERIENTARKEFEWHEELDLRYKLHMYWKAKSGSEPWGYRETAQKLECSLGGLSSDLALAEALIHFPELKELHTKAKAREAYKKFGEQAKAIQSMKNLSDEERERFEQMKSGNIKIEKPTKPKLKAKHEDTIPDVTNLRGGSHDEQPVEESLESQLPEPIYVVEDLYTFIPKIPDSTVGFIELDPLYAIDFDETYGKTGKIKKDKDAKDWTTEELFHFYTTMLPVLYEKLLDSSWILCWTGKEHFVETNKIAAKCGFKVQSPGIWPKIGGGSNTPKTNMISNYEMFLLFRKGTATFNTNSMLSILPVFSQPATKKSHQWEKPIEMYNYLMKIFAKPGSIFLSPFAGSGNSMIAAGLAGMFPMGCDLEEKYVYKFFENYNNYSYGE